MDLARIQVFSRRCEVEEEEEVGLLVAVFLVRSFFFLQRGGKGEAAISLGEGIKSFQRERERS